ERLGHDRLLRNLAGEKATPEVEGARGDLALYGRQGLGQGDRFWAGELGQEGIEAEYVVAVAVGDVDRCQSLALRANPLGRLPRLIEGDQGIDEDRITVAAEQRDGAGRPRCLALVHHRGVAGYGLVVADVHIEGEFTWHQNYSRRVLIACDAVVARGRLCARVGCSAGAVIAGRWLSPCDRQADRAALVSAGAQCKSPVMARASPSWRSHRGQPADGECFRDN